MRRVSLLTWKGISIHALLAESDNMRMNHIICDCNFYPRSPCGERLQGITLAGALFDISIHALLAESDPRHARTKGKRVISIHALLAESDSGTKSE